MVAAVYNLPDGNSDYARVDMAASGLPAGTDVIFYAEDKSTVPGTGTAKEDGTMDLIDLSGLAAEGGTVYASLGGSSEPVAIAYPAQPDFLVRPDPVTAYTGRTVTVSAEALGNYTAESAVFTAESAEIVTVVSATGLQAILQGVAKGETSLTVEVTFTHPDPLVLEKGNVTRQVVVTVEEGTAPTSAYVRPGTR